MENALQESRYLAIKPEGLPAKAWDEILDSWRNGLSDREAAFRASERIGELITEAEIKELVRADHTIARLRDDLHNELIKQAKLVIADSIGKGNLSTAKWFLERKAPEEFSSKAAIAFEGAVVGLSMDEKKEQMDEFMKQFGGEAADNSVLKVGEFPDE